MKTVRIYGPYEGRIDDIPVKEPGNGEVLVKVKAVGICGTDQEIYSNNLIYIKDGISRLPMIPGHEWSGVVEKAGKGVTRFKAGDKVTGECTVSCMKCRYCFAGKYNMCVNRTETGIINRDGAFAEYLTFPESHLHRFNTLPFEHAALIEPLGIALYAMIRGNIGPEDNVLVTGPGPIGLLAAQTAKKVYGAGKVILSGTRDDRLERSRNYGLDGAVNIRRESLKERVSEITGGRMVNAVIDTSGSGAIFDEIKDIINPAGRIVLVGFFGESAKIDLDYFIVRDINIISSLGSPNVWELAIDLLEASKIDAESVISHKLGLDEYEKAFDILQGRKENVCKIILNRFG